MGDRKILLIFYLPLPLSTILPNISFSLDLSLSQTIFPYLKCSFPMSVCSLVGKFFGWFLKRAVCYICILHYYVTWQKYMNKKLYFFPTKSLNQLIYHFRKNLQYPHYLIGQNREGGSLWYFNFGFTFIMMHDLTKLSSFLDA